MNKQTTKKTLTIVAAGKIAMSSACAGGLGKVEEDSTPDSPHLSLDQVGYPLDILSPPKLTEKINIETSAGGKLSSDETVGVLYQRDIELALDATKQPRIDFVIKNIHNKGTPVVIFLMYSPKLGHPDQWLDLQFQTRDLQLDRETFKIISAFTMEQRQPLGDFNQTSTPLGELARQDSSTIISVKISDLTDIEFADDQIYFQAVAVPIVNDRFDFSDTRISELDQYRIARPVSGDDNSGSKITQDSGSKSDSSSGSDDQQNKDTGGK